MNAGAFQGRYRSFRKGRSVRVRCTKGVDNIQQFTLFFLSQLRVDGRVHQAGSERAQLGQLSLLKETCGTHYALPSLPEKALETSSFWRAW